MLHSSHLPLPCASGRTVSRSPSLPPAHPPSPLRAPSRAARTVSHFPMLHRIALPHALLHIVSCVSALSRTACVSPIESRALWLRLVTLSHCAAPRLRARALHGAASPVVAPTRHPLAPHSGAMRPTPLDPRAGLLLLNASSYALQRCLGLCRTLSNSAVAHSRARGTASSPSRPSASPSPAVACRRTLVLLPRAPAAPFHAPVSLPRPCNVAFPLPLMPPRA
ncbi:hypothetical protein DENSPDRAFT_886642 [Dentipellis sp. KUC8613]|nr:hypothetical protein DENSPDRAFT_886642 [Dentipellis sp. KUC8613]